MSEIPKGRVFADEERGCDPLTPDDIAEVVVFACSRRENVVVADSMLFPNYQVSLEMTDERDRIDVCGRHQLWIFIGKCSLSEPAPYQF